VEIELADERVKLYGQTEPIETLHGQVVAGWLEYLACVESKTTPIYTEIDEPDDLLEYLVRRNVPRHLSTLDRACIAVLAQEQYQKLGFERMREGGRRGGLAKGRARDARPFSGERWTHTAARLVGTTEGAVRRLAQLRRNAPDLLEAVRSRRLLLLRDARDLANGLRTPEERAEALILRDADPWAPIARIIAHVHRGRRPQLPTPKKANLSGRSWTVYAGPMETEAGRITDESIDLVHADVVYGRVRMASEVARIAARVLVDGGILALIPGNNGCHEVITAVTAEGLALLTIGSLFYPGGYPVARGPFERIDTIPVLIFVKGSKPARRISHLAFTSEAKSKTHHRWEKNVDATLDLVKSLVDPGTRVLDPCCGSGTTGEAALQHGCEFIGIDIDPEAIKIAAARLAGVERELAGG
jgi:ubiquinone/menaquinone biosynthesis C-methylase UbiE